MSNSSSYTSADRVVDRFLELTRMAQQLGINRKLIEDTEFRGDTITLDGREVVNFGLCSYLGLGDDRRLVDAAKDAIDRYGNSYSSSLAYTGLPLYRDLKDRLATMLDSPVVVAGTTTLAHLAALPILVRPGDLVLIDAYAHASLVSVMPSLEVNGAKIRQVDHNDLETVAHTVASTNSRVWYVIDGLYSMHGDTAPAEQIYTLLDASPNLWVYCDDAHSLGWAGDKGQGLFLARAGWHERLVMSFGLAKSFGSLGGVIACQSPSLLEAIEVVGGPMLFGGPLPPGVLAANIASADIHLSEELHPLQADLMARIRFVNTFSADIGLPLHNLEETPLWFVEMGQTMKVISAVKSMLNEGHYLNGAAYPAVPRGRGGVRFTVTRYNTLDQIERMLLSLRDIREKYLAHDDIIDLTALEDVARDAP